MPEAVHPAVAALMVVLPAGDGRDEEVDHAALAAGWGTAFPDDYLSFMRAYGSCSLGDALVVVNPGLPDDYSGMADETGNARVTCQQMPPDDGPPESAAHIIAWGATAGADMLCWHTADPDPNRWPVLVWRRGTSPHWAVFDCGMPEFLRRLVTGEEDPRFNVALKRDDTGTLTFTSERDENRARIAMLTEFAARRAAGDPGPPDSFTPRRKPTPRPGGNDRTGTPERPGPRLDNRWRQRRPADHDT